MNRKEQIRNKAKELGQQYFPDSSNIWARSNVEACYVENACVEMAEWLDQHPHWIPVEEELPKERGKLYLVCDKYGRVCESAYDVEDDIWYRQSGTVLSPTHWMPLPEAPRKEGK